jgi:hypothetical protein
MKPLSHAEAFDRFERWQSSPVTVNFGRQDAGVSFFLQMATLEVSTSSLLLEVKESSMVILHFKETEVTFTELTNEDIKREFSRLRPVNPKVKACVGAKFSNGDFCLVGQE